MKEPTPDLITELKDGEIFVFGSNTSGRHSKGAAKTALGWGAKFGQAAGLQGKTYGIPTVNASITNKLSVSKIKVYVDEFTEFAKDHPELTFLVTEVGCGLASHNYKDIGPLFKEAAQLSNVRIPKRFARTIK